MAAIAFYKGKGNLVDRLIRFVTRSEYSHCEFLFDPTATLTGKVEARPCWSSSARDGGVRLKKMKLDPNRWDIVPIEFEFGSNVAKVIFEAEEGRSYDYLGIVLSQFFNLGRHDRNRWFCSEICAHAIGFLEPQTFSPGALKRRLEETNRFVNLARHGRN